VLLTPTSTGQNRPCSASLARPEASMTEFSPPRRRVVLWTLCGVLLQCPHLLAKAASRNASTSSIPDSA